MAEINRQSIIRACVAVTFAGFLIVPALLNHRTTQAQSREYAMERETSLKKYGFYLQEVAEQSGVHFVHHSPLLDPQINPILPQIASMGASVSISDFNSDGWNDIYVTNSRFGYKNALYRNNKDGSFIDVADEMGVAELNREATGVSMGSVWADFDNDGYEDLLVYKWGRPELFRNNRGSGFTNVTGESYLPDWINANTAIWLDYNSDGYVDLFIGGYFREDIDLWHLKNTRIFTESFEYSQNGGRNFLFRNNGKGIFEDVTKETGLTSTRWTLAAGAVDINQDGYPELIIANDFGIDEFYLNEKGKRFIEYNKGTMVGFSPKSGMNVSFGDVYNQGQFGIYISNITEEGILLQGNNFWVPYHDDDRVLYLNEAGKAGIEDGGWSYSAQFGDLNNDGSQDLYLANGYISGEKGTSYWYDYSKVTGGNESIISDLKNWPAMNGRSQSGYQQNKIWINNGAGHFYDASNQVAEKESFDSRGVAFADLLNKGVLDVIVANQDNELLIYRNRVTGENHWIEFELEGSSTNRSAINAQVELYWDSKKQIQAVTGGIGFCSQNQRRIHFGLGQHPKVDKAVIRWPNGKEQIIENPQADKIHHIIEMP